MKKLVVVALIGSFLLAGCSSSQKIVKKDQSYRIQKGMTQEQIVEIFGDPDGKGIKKHGDVFYYSSKNPFLTLSLWICFGNSNKVSGVTNSNTYLFCQENPW